MRTIYSKVTVGRNKKFTIETKIINENKKLYVYKKGLYDNNHLLNAYNNILLSKSIYNDFIPDCKYENNYLITEYVKGKTLLDFAKNDLDSAIKIYNDLINQNNSNKIDFYITNEFKNIFGEINYEGKAFKLSNIDFTFSNIILNENSIKFIDLEWLSNFPIPIDYIKYRAFLDLINNGFFDKKEELLIKFNLNDIELFNKMEESFQNYVCEKSYKNLLMKEEHYIFNAIENYNLKVNSLYDEIDKIKNDLSIKLKENDDLNLNLSKSLKENEILNNQNISLNKKIDSLKSDNLNLNNQLENKKQELEEKENDLRQTSEELNRIKSSTSYRFLLKYYKVRDFFLPPNSKRKLFVKLMFSAIRHPIWFIKHITPSNVKKFNKYRRSEGADRVLERINIYKANNSDFSDRAQIELFDMKKRDNYPTLMLPLNNKPLVSIIIPVYNQFSYTYGCIESIIKNTEMINYEVIIGDDCSTDETQDIKKYVKNIIVARNEKNTRFLLNCKNAAKYAKGKYILFLNNDTNVQPNWLTSLIETIESDPKIGMVGSKLVYPNGQLQEAGGILWKDGSAWNFGNKGNPEASEYNYRKPVDYISGAAIMLSKKLWDDLGGFDELFTPAYCEDSDLAFQVRKAGYEVIYDPFSVVVHYEGISNGTDVKQGVKQYQVDNSKKFYEKWKNVLENHYPNAENVFVARERSFTKKKILVIDHYVPQYDKDAGSKTIFNYLKLFTKLNYSVKFLGENFYKHEPYTTELEKLGVEVLYGPYYANNYKEWLRQNGKYFDFVFLNRPHITKKFINDVKQTCTNAKLIYYGHDLHYVRMQREYELNKNPKTLEEMNMWKEIEYQIFNQVDLIYYPSIIEKNILDKELPNKNIKVLQPYFYENIKPINYNYKNRKDILFVGGFRHQPNYDGINWFITEVFDKIVKANPRIVLHVAGSYPPQELLDKASKNLIIEGFVTEERLKELYESVRIVIVPLRYGAGIKGKVIEAMANGVPVITTSIGAEGIDTDALLVDDTLLSINEYYNNEKWLKNQSKKEIDFIMNNYSFDSAKNNIEIDFKEIK